MEVSESFWNASFEELVNGYVEDKENFCCLLCGHKVEKGIIYAEDGVFYEAEKSMRIHIKKGHGSVFEYLIQLDKKFTGLTDHQKRLLGFFYQGKSDEQVREEMNIGSAATIRNHRFGLKEKERQAKVFLTMMELLKAKDRDKKVPDFIPPYSTATIVDDQYTVTADENDKILKKYFTQGLNGPIKTLNMKEKNKLVVLRQIAQRFDPNRIYSEKEVNEILKNVYTDFVLVRRYLIEYGFMDRKPDGSQYWVRKNQLEMTEIPEKKDEIMDRKKDLKQQYKEVKPQAGIYMIKNTKNQKVLVASTANLKTMNGKLMQLQGGGHMNKQLQEEWKLFGQDAFVFEVLEVLEEKEEGYFDQQEELKKLEAQWLANLQPFGERGYNVSK